MFLNDKLPIQAAECIVQDTWSVYVPDVWQAKPSFSFIRYVILVVSLIIFVPYYLNFCFHRTIAVRCVTTMRCTNLYFTYLLHLCGPRNGLEKLKSLCFEFVKLYCIYIHTIHTVLLWRYAPVLHTGTFSRRRYIFFVFLICTDCKFTALFM